MNLAQRINWARTYYDVVNHAGEQAKATGDKEWTALYFAGLAVGVAWAGVKVAHGYLDYRSTSNKE